MVHIVKNLLRDDALKKRTEVIRITWNVIDKTIEILPKRVEAIIKSGGYQTKYQCLFIFTQITKHDSTR